MIRFLNFKKENGIQELKKGRGDAAEVGETRRERRCGTLYVYDNRRNSGGLVVFGAVKVKTRPLGY